jgi:branched-chain amino acid transport system substrate-binding protein
MLKKGSACLLVVALLCLCVGIGTGLSAEKIKIATLCPISGPAASWGLAVVRGVELMADKINADGGVDVAGKKHEIELIQGDTKANPEVALSEANRLIFNEKIKYIIGPNVSSATLAILPITEREKVLVSSFSYASEVLGSDKKYSFRLYPAGREYISALFSYLKQHRPEAKTLALVGFNDQSSLDNAEIAKTLAEGEGLQIVFKDFVQRGTTDFFPLLTNLLAKKPDIIAPIAFTDGPAALILQQARQMNFKGDFAFHTFHSVKDLEQKAGKEALEGTIMITIDNRHPKAPKAMQDLVPVYEKKYNEAFSSVANATYPVLAILAKGIEKAKSLDTTAVAKVLEDLEGPYPYGGTFSMGGLKTYGAKRQIVAPIFMSVYKNGQQEFMGTVSPPVP